MGARAQDVAGVPQPLSRTRLHLEGGRERAFSKLSSDDTARRLEALAELEVHSIEQPLMPADQDGLADLADRAIVPIALDESLIGVTSLAERMRLLDHVRPQHLVLKPSLVGGLDGATVWSKLAEQRGMGWWVTSALESNVGLSAIAQWVAVQPAVADAVTSASRLGHRRAVHQQHSWQPRSATRPAAHCVPVVEGRNPLAPSPEGAVPHEPGCACGGHHDAP